MGIDKYLAVAVLCLASAIASSTPAEAKTSVPASTYVSNPPGGHATSGIYRSPAVTSESLKSLQVVRYKQDTDEILYGIAASGPSNDLSSKLDKRTVQGENASRKHEAGEAATEIPPYIYGWILSFALIGFMTVAGRREI